MAHKLLLSYTHIITCLFRRGLTVNSELNPGSKVKKGGIEGNLSLIVDNERLLVAQRKTRSFRL